MDGKRTKYCALKRVPVLGVEPPRPGLRGTAASASAEVISTMPLWQAFCLVGGAVRAGRMGRAGGQGLNRSAGRSGFRYGPTDAS